MQENRFEYAVEEKARGKNLRMRLLLVLGYVLFSAGFFLLFYSIRIPQVVALLPLFLWIVVWYTWRFVQVTHEYVIETGAITFYTSYANRKKKEKLSVRIRDLRHVGPADHEPRPKETRVYDFRSEKSAPDSFYLLYQDERGGEVVVYFEATAKALKLLQLYNSSASIYQGELRY